MLAGRVRLPVTSEQRKPSESKRPFVPGRLHIGGAKVGDAEGVARARSPASRGWTSSTFASDPVGAAQNPPVLRAPNATFTAERRKRRASFPSSEQFAASFVDLLRE